MGKYDVKLNIRVRDRLRNDIGHVLPSSTLRELDERIANRLTKNVSIRSVIGPNGEPIVEWTSDGGGELPPVTKSKKYLRLKRLVAHIRAQNPGRTIRWVNAGEFGDITIYPTGDDWVKYTSEEAMYEAEAGINYGQTFTGPIVNSMPSEVGLNIVSFSDSILAGASDIKASQQMPSSYIVRKVYTQANNNSIQFRTRIYVENDNDETQTTGINVFSVYSKPGNDFVSMSTVSREYEVNYPVGRPGTYIKIKINNDSVIGTAFLCSVYIQDTSKV